MKKLILFIASITIITACQKDVQHELTADEREQIAIEIKAHQAKMRNMLEVANMENLQKWIDEMVPGEDEVWMDNPAMWLNMLTLYRNEADMNKVWEPELDRRSSTVMKAYKEYVALLSPENALYVVDGSFSITDNDGNNSGDIPLSGTFVYTKKDGKWKILHIHYSWEEE